MNKTLLSTVVLCLAATAANAQNPIIRDQFTTSSLPILRHAYLIIRCTCTRRMTSCRLLVSDRIGSAWRTIMSSLQRTSPTGQITESLSPRTKYPGYVLTPIPCGLPTVSSVTASTISIFPQLLKMVVVSVSVLLLLTVPRDRSSVSPNPSRASMVSTPVCSRLLTAMPTSFGVQAVVPSSSPI